MEVLPENGDEIREAVPPASLCADGESGYSDGVLVVPWPAATPEDSCGCMVRRRFEEWARAQARWLGSQALAAQAPGTAALVAASLWA
eukprot:15209552-Alexandrium_andersonii.AAC.1